MKFLPLKGRISQIEDDVHENISTIYKMMEQNKDFVNHSNHMSDMVNTENISKVISGVGQAVPDETNQTNQNTEKQQQNTDNIYLFNKDKICNVNQNYAVLDRPQVPRVTNSHTHSPKSSNVTMKPQLYEGDEDLNEYLAQFEILAEINGWNYATKSLYLACSLKGGARALLNELDKESNALPDADLRLRLRESNPKSIHEAETLAVRLETLKLAERQKGRMVRQADSVQTDNKINTELNNDKEEEFKSIRHELSDLRENWYH
ncbi:unnamed protein product [Mytilus coruscus]|uniref:Uncharacterized protein n=1 Tax=Mytilus coruscus TaxID=42192 RepID=A0A6J8E504_MYTCO|nr:unnamed protein product [Mytilus coruscus]